ncbi:MAG: hypothetical protein ACHQJX_06080 [Candidatus Acidiferrales bacterium]
MNAKEESEKLINALLPFTEQMLQRYGEFYPHGGYMRQDGEVVLLGAQDSDSDHPKSEDLICILRDSLRQVAGAKACKAVAIVFDVVVNLPEPQRKGDAIQVCIEHEDGYAAEVFFPYQIADGKLVYGETFAQKGDPRFFG